MQNPNLVKWENRLNKVFDTVDDILEDEYGDLFPIHPARARRGHTSNKKQDGLFGVGADFSLGIGSQIGPSYVLEIRMVTLSAVPGKIREKIENRALTLIRDGFNKEFPDRDLRITRDMNVFRIHGDLSLGSV